MGFGRGSFDKKGRDRGPCIGIMVAQCWEDLMQILPRFNPGSGGGLHLIPEYAAAEPLQSRYAEIRRTFDDAPWVGVNMIAYSSYPNFFQSLMARVTSACQTSEYRSAAQTLRKEIEEAVGVLRPPSLQERLIAIGYYPREIADIKATLEVLSRWNYLYTLATTLARGLIEGATMVPPRSWTPYISSPASIPNGSLIRAEEHHAGNSLRALYSNIRQTLGLEFLNTDYRALGRWPTYLTMAWEDLSPHVWTSVYESVCEVYNTRSQELTWCLANPAGIAEGQAAIAAQKDGFSEVLSVVRLFHYLHGGLMTNVAFFRAQLCG